MIEGFECGGKHFAGQTSPWRKGIVMRLLAIDDVFR